MPAMFVNRQSSIVNRRMCDHMKILRLDASGHSTILAEALAPEAFDKAFHGLCAQGYAMFLDDVQIKEVPVDRPDAEILALPALVGG